MSETTLVLNDRYEVERELGRGGMSVVYLARDRQLLAKRVVIKVLLEETGQDPWIRQKFLQEMEALARIDHPGVVGVLDTGLTAEGRQFLVMQYIEGVTLRTAIEPGGVGFRRAADLIRQIGHALAAAHEKGVWHRDLKPENIMLQRLGGEEHVKLIDFGIAGIQNSRFSGEKTRVAGSLTYMAPEHFAGHPCAATDTYALGVVAYELLTGKTPFSGDSMVHLVTEGKARPLPPRALRPELPEAAERSILKAMSFRTELRQADAVEFSEELFQALTGTLTAGEPTVEPDPTSTVEIAHVLFTDLVSYSLLPMDQQKDYLGQLQKIVRDSPQFRAAEASGDIISLPTGDGMALAFFGDPTMPVQCALEVAQGLKSKPHLKLRMGIHSGPVYRVADVNAKANVAGGGINIAQRVMDCGDAGHILVSKTVADVLLQLSQWSPFITDLGEVTVKHGVKVHIYSLATAELGNRERPHKLVAAVASKPKSKAPLAVALALLVVAAVVGGWWLVRSGKSSLSVPDKSSVAVLPFADISPEKNQEYFSDGLTEELLNGLAKIPGLRVAGRTSSFQFKGKTGDYTVIGEKLHVAAILEGSVRKQNNRAKINVQLIHAADGFDLWSESFDREMNDIFATQEDIARAVTGALKIKLLGAKTDARPAQGTNADAYNAYLQGRYFLAQRTKESLEKAVDSFVEATKLDSGYAPAWAGLGVCRTYQAGEAYIPIEEGFQKAREAVARALALDANLGQAHAAMGTILMIHDWNWSAAEKSYRQARALQPGDADAIKGAGMLARNLGHFNEAIALYRQAIAIDPLHADYYKNIGIIYYYAGRQAEAKSAFEKALDLTPQMPFVHGYLGEVYLAQSHPREALAEMEKEKHPALRLFGRALAYHALGQKKESDASLAELIAKFQNDVLFQLAEVYAFRGETNRAFEWLDRSYAEHDDGLAEMKGNPLLKSLERDPRYSALLKKMRLPI